MPPVTRHYSRLIILFALILGVSPLCGQQFRQNRVAAIVNKKIITAGTVLDHVRKNFLNTNEPITPRRLEEAKSVALSDLVNRELVLQEYKEQKFSLPDSIFEKRIKDTMLQNGFPTRASLVRALKREGKTYDEHAREQRERIIVMIMLGEFASTKGIVISPRKIENYYIANKNQFRRDVEIKLQMIVLNESDHGGKDATSRLANEIHAKLTSGESFSQMARIYSDLYAQSSGFRADWDKKSIAGMPGTLDKALEALAFSLGQGQISEVVQHDNRCWILRCDEIHQKELRSLADVRDEIEDALMKIESDARKQKWFNKLRAKAYVKTRSF